MSPRALALLAAVTVAALAAALYVHRGEEPAPPRRAAEPFLPGLAGHLDAVTAVEARVAGGRLLARVESAGDGWRVANRDGYPADAATLRATLVGLADARRLAARTDRPAGWARMGLRPIDDPAAQGVELTIEGVDGGLTVIVGEPAAGQAEATYVRRAGAGARAWLVDAAIERPDTIADWLDETILDLAAERLRRVALVPRDGQRVEVVRTGDGFAIANRPDGRRPLSPTIADSLARVVTGLALEDVVPAVAVEAPPVLATGRFETRDGLVVELEALAPGRGAGADGGYLRARARALTGAGVDAERQAAGIDDRCGGWLYRIPEYKFINLTQTLEGVLAPAE